MRRILVTGSRNWEEKELLEDQLDDEWDERGPFILVHGQCPTGADAMADDYINTCYETSIESYPADWSKGKAAGPLRNKYMVSLLNPKTDRVIAFLKDNSRGTTGCINLALDARLPVRIVRPDGNFKDVQRV